MDKEDQKLSEEAFEWVKKNQRKLIEKFASVKDYASDNKPVTLFMAGSPGAGKTEVAKRLADKFKARPVIIDADEIRKFCNGYNGSNAHVFQKAANRGIHILYNHALANDLNIILDGTFAYADWMINVERSVKRGRKVELYYVYQPPAAAWRLTQIREAIEKRKVSKEIFINAFIKSRENANEAKRHFGDALEMHLIIKNNNSDIERFKFNIVNIDYFIKNKYSIEELKDL